MTDYVLEAKDTVEMYVKNKESFKEEGEEEYKEEKEQKHQKKEKKEEEKKRLLYDLYAISNHSGGMGGGHYTAYVKNFRNQKWFNMNDSSCSHSGSGSLSSARSYILFYKKQSSRKEVEQKIEIETKIEKPEKIDDLD